MLASGYVEGAAWALESGTFGASFPSLAGTRELGSHRIADMQTCTRCRHSCSEHHTGAFVEGEVVDGAGCGDGLVVGLERVPAFGSVGNLFLVVTVLEQGLSSFLWGRRSRF